MLLSGSEADAVLGETPATLTNVVAVLVHVRGGGDVACVIYVDGVVADQMSGSREASCLWTAPRV